MPDTRTRLYVSSDSVATVIFVYLSLIPYFHPKSNENQILNGLGFDDRLMEKPTSDLSGGWAMRAALGAAIFVNPNLLLLGMYVSRYR